MRQPIEVKSSNLISTKIFVDDDSIDSSGNVIEWLPKDGYLKVNVTADVHGNRVITLPYRCFATIDCGFSMELNDHFQANVEAEKEMASKGLVILHVPENNGRTSILVGNVGKEILTLKHGDKVARMYASPIYGFSWEQV